MAHRHAEFFEVAVRQIGQNLGVDFVFQEQRLVFTETEAPQPIPDVHTRSSNEPGSKMVPGETASSGHRFLNDRYGS